MDIGSALFGIFAVACFVVPIIYLQRVKKNEKRKFLNEFLQLAKQENLTIDEHDFWNHSCAIGIDASQKKLFYLKKEEGKDEICVINLTEVEQATLIIKSRKLNDNKVVDLLGLGFTFKNGMFPDKTVKFYNRDENMAVNGELHLTEKWHSIIQLNLKAIPAENKTIKLKSNSATAA